MSWILRYHGANFDVQASTKMHTPIKQWKPYIYQETRNLTTISRGHNKPVIDLIVARRRNLVDLEYLSYSETQVTRSCLVPRNKLIVEHVEGSRHQRRNKLHCGKLSFRSMSYTCQPIAHASLMLCQLHSHVSAHLNIFIRPPTSRLQFDVPLVRTFPFVRSSARGGMQLFHARKPICSIKQRYEVPPTFTRACGLSMHLNDCRRSISCPRTIKAYAPGTPYRGVWLTVKQER